MSYKVQLDKELPALEKCSNSSEQQPYAYLVGHNVMSYPRNNSWMSVKELFPVRSFVTWKSETHYLKLLTVKPLFRSSAEVR